MSKKDIVLKRVFKLSKRELFDAWSKPELMCRWFFATRERPASCSVENSFVTQGDFKLVMHLSNMDVNIFGKYTEINRYNIISFSWNSPAVSDTLVTLKFRELSASRTELTLIHQLLPDQTLRDQHTEGWNACFDNLAELEGVVE